MAYGQEKISGMLALGLCNGFATCLILVVLGLRKWMRLAFTMGDAWLAIALLFNTLRMVGDYYINEFGTPLSISMYFATASTDGNISDLVLPDDIQDGLILAGKLMVLARVSIVFVIWSLNMTFLDVMSASLPRDFQFKRQTFWLMYAVMGATFSTSSISVFLECGDLKLNWTLFPEADKCSYGSLWIITYEISNIIMDNMICALLGFLIFKSPASKWDPIKLSFFAMWFIWGVIEVVRVVHGEPFNDVLFNRIVWSSVEVVIATSAATIPTICMLLRLGFDVRQAGSRKGISRGYGESAIAINTAGEPGQQGGWSPRDRGTWGHPTIWDGPTPTDPRTLGETHKPLQPNPLSSSAINLVLPEVGNEGNRPKSRSSFRNSLPNSYRSSRASRGRSMTNSGYYDTMGGWFELEEVNSRDVAEGGSSREPDGAQSRNSGIFVATEIHRANELESRPRIITIPQRARQHPRSLV